MGDGYAGLKNFVVAMDRMAGTAVIGCVVLLALWLISQALQTRSDTPGARANNTMEASYGTLDTAGPLTASDLRTVQSKLEGLGFKPGVVDGIAGGRTLDALNRYREAKMLERVSEINHATVGALLD